MLEQLQTRTSFSAMLLDEPGPTPSELEQILNAGLTAPDHAAMSPWRFITIQGKAREQLGDVFAAAAIKDNPDMPEEKVIRVRQKPLRSPLIVVIVATITEDHPKTPVVEQILSAGAAATLIQLAATASGFGSIWLSGPNAYFPDVKAALGVSEKDQIIGYLYMGTPTKPATVKPRPTLAEHVSEWHAPVG